MKNLRKILLLPVLALPLMAPDCTEVKEVDLVIGLPTTVEVEFTSTGSLNVHEDTDDVDLGEDIDLDAELDDVDIDPNDVEQIAVVQIFYRITQGQAGKQISDGDLEITRGSGTGGSFTPAGPTVDLATDFSADAGAATDWIDITDQLASGITVLNDLAAELLDELKTGGTPATNTVIRYHVRGVVTPDTATNIKWEIKLLIQATTSEEFEIPFG